MSNIIQATTGARPVYKTDGASYGVEFNVSANPQYLVADIPTGFAEATAYSFALWMKLRDAIGELNNAPNIFMASVNDGSTTSAIGICSVGGELTMTVAGVDTLVGNAARTAPAALDTWVHVCGTVNGTAITIYKNGVSSGTAANLTGVPVPEDVSALRISVGAARDGARPVRMMASNLQIWNIALTAQQIQDYAMKRITGTPPAGLIFYAPL